MQPLQAEIERLFALGAQAKTEPSARETFLEFRAALSRGKIRAAEKRGHEWHANVWVKQGILLGFRMGVIADMSIDAAKLPFFDKSTYPVRPMTTSDGVRIVPGGSSIRDGSHIGRGVICMPPMFVNVGDRLKVDPREGRYISRA